MQTRTALNELLLVDMTKCLTNKVPHLLCHTQHVFEKHGADNGRLTKRRLCHIMVT